MWKNKTLEFYQIILPSPPQINHPCDPVLFSPSGGGKLKLCRTNLKEFHRKSSKFSAPTAKYEDIESVFIGTCM